MGLYSDLKDISVTLTGATKSAAFRVDGGFTIMAVETDSSWSTADISFEASSQEFDGSPTFSITDARFKPAFDKDHAPVGASGVTASCFENVGGNLVGHFFKLVSSVSQTGPTTVKVFYRLIA